MTHDTIKYIVLVFLYMLHNNFQTNEHRIWGMDRTKCARESGVETQGKKKVKSIGRRNRCKFRLSVCIGSEYVVANFGRFIVGMLFNVHGMSGVSVIWMLAALFQPSSLPFPPPSPPTPSHIVFVCMIAHTHKYG